MLPINRTWKLKWIVTIVSIAAATFAMLAIAALTVGHLKIVSGTENIELVTVPGVLETSRIVRNLEQLRRYGDTALSTTSSVERNRAQMSVTLIAMHPGMQASEKVKSRVQNARIALGQAITLATQQTTDEATPEKALSLWTPIAEDLTMLADELTMESSRRASDDAHRIHMISSKTLSWLTFAIAALLLCGLLFGGFLQICIARPLQRTAQVLDQLENNETIKISLLASPVREIERLRTAAHALAAAMTSSEQHRIQLEMTLAENRQRTVELENALTEIKQLRGIIPICSYCKKIRNDQESWQQLETYISEHSEAVFTHGACPDCFAEQMKIIENM